MLHVFKSAINSEDTETFSEKKKVKKLANNQRQWTCNL